MIRSEGASAMESKQDRNKPTAAEREEVLDLVSGHSTELCDVKITASIDLDVLVSAVSSLSHGMDQLKH